jgi:hypothetical protein
MIVNIHYQIATREVLSLPQRFWYSSRTSRVGSRMNTAASFPLELEQLISQEALLIIHSGAVGTNVLLCATSLRFSRDLGESMTLSTLATCLHPVSASSLAMRPTPTPLQSSCHRT